MGADFSPLFLLKNRSEIFIRNIFFSQKLFCKFVKTNEMEKFEILTIFNIVLLIAFIFVLYKVFIFAKRQGDIIAFIITSLVFILVPKNCQKQSGENLQEVVNNVIEKEALRKKYKIFKLENHQSYSVQNLQVDYLVYFDEDHNLRIFDERVGLGGFVLGTDFDEIPFFTTVEKRPNNSYQITSILYYHSFFVSDSFLMKKIFSAEEITKISSKEGKEYFIHHPKFENPSYYY